MERAIVPVIFTALIGIPVGSDSSPIGNNPPPGNRNMSLWNRRRLRFEANLGQTDNQVKFLARGSGHTLFLTETEAVLSFAGRPASELPDAGTRGCGDAAKVGYLNSNSNWGEDSGDFGHMSSGHWLSRHPSDGQAVAASPSVLRVRFIGASSSPRITGLDELPGRSNYFLGSGRPAQRGWHTNVRSYARVEYQGVYPGIDLVFYGDDAQLEYDFIIEPGRDPDVIALGIEGASELKVDAEGDLIMRTTGGEIRQRRPRAYQLSGQLKQDIASRYVLMDGQRLGFRVAGYDSARPVIIDPMLSYSTYLGGSGMDAGVGIALDAAGNAYITGRTASANFPSKNPRQPALGGGSDVFVTKLDAKGSGLIYSTYLGGSGDDEGRGIVVDSSGNAYVTGRTASANFPTKSPFQTDRRGPADAFIVKLSATGSDLVYASYLGGSSTDEANGLAIDSAGNAYVAGFTQSNDFPTMTPFQAAAGGFGDAFVTKVNPEGSVFTYSTFLGGGGIDQANSIAVDSLGNAYITGRTSSTNFPVTANAFKGTSSVAPDAFVAKLDPSMPGMGSLLYSTYLGGNGSDEGRGIAVDKSGGVYVTGDTSSTNFPTVNPFQAARAGASGFDAFVSKFNFSESGAPTLLYSSYLGGGGFDDHATCITVDTAGNAYVTGFTNSTNFPTAHPTQSTSGGFTDGFVTKVNKEGSALVVSTYIGGSGTDEGSGIAVEPSGGVYYLTGRSNSTNFPVTEGSVQRTNGGTFDAFVARIVEIADLSLTKTASSAAAVPGQTLTYTLVVSNAGPDSATGVTVTDPLPSGTVFVSCEASPGRCSGPQAGIGGAVTSTFEAIGAGQSATSTFVIRLGSVGLSVRNVATVSSATLDPNNANNTASATTTVTPRLLVSSFNTDSVLRFNGATGASSGAFVTSGSGGLKGPFQFAFGPDGNLYVASFGTDSVKRYEGSTGAYINDFVPTGSGGLSGPSGLVFGPDGNLYVTSRDRILRYNGANGAFMNAFVPAGGGGLSDAQALVFGPDQNLYVSNSPIFFYTVLRYNGRTGAFIDAFVPPSSGGLFGPQGLVFGPDGNLYVSSRFNSVVLRYNGSSGAFIGTFASGGGLSAPAGLEFGPDGHLYVCSGNTSSIKRYNGSTGAYMDDFVAAGSGGLMGPAYLVFN